jgi:hypothetical protein
VKWHSCDAAGDIWQARCRGGKAPVGPGARLFMLERLVDVTLANMPRVHQLWPEVEAHFFDMSSRETSVELCRIISKQLGRALVGMLGNAGPARNCSPHHILHIQNLSVKTACR